MNYILYQIDNNILFDESNLFKSLTLKEAICFILIVWNNITKAVIKPYVPQETVIKLCFIH